MRYNPENSAWNFSTQQYLTNEEEAEFISAWRQQQLSRMRVNLPAADASPTQWLGILGAVLFIGMMIGCVAAFMMGHPAVGVVAFGAMFILAGLMIACSREDTNPESGNTAMSHRAVGILIAMIGLMIVVPMLLINKIGEARAVLCLGAGTFFSAGMFFTVETALEIIRTGRNFGDTVDARCIGYARRVQSGNNQVTRVRTHEVFEYEYNGEFYQAVNPVGAMRDGGIAVGETVEVHISRSKPEDPVYAENRRYSVGGAIGTLAFTSLFVLVGLGLFVFAAVGDVNDEDFHYQNKLRPEANAADSLIDGKYPLDDETIYEKIGDHETHWIIEKFEITKKYEDDEYGWMLEFSDGSLHKATKEIWDKYYVGMQFYQISNEDSGEILTGFKCESCEYVGSHTLHDYTD